MLCAGASQEARGSRGGRTERAPVMGTAAGANAEADAASASNRPTVECIVGVYAGEPEAVLISPSFRTSAHIQAQPSGKMIAAGMNAPFQLQHLSASPPDLAMFAVLDMSSPSAVSDSRSPSRLRVRDSRPAQCLIAAGGVQLLRVPHINVLAHGGRRALHQGRQGGCQRQAPDPAGDAGLLGQVSARMAVGGAAICVAVSVCCVAGLVGGGPFPCPSVLSVCACACVLVLVGASAVSTASNDALLPAPCPPAPCPPPPCRVALPSHLSSFSGH